MAHKSHCLIGQKRIGMMTRMCKYAKLWTLSPNHKPQRTSLVGVCGSCAVRVHMCWESITAIQQTVILEWRTVSKMCLSEQQVKYQPKWQEKSSIFSKFYHKTQPEENVTAQRSPRDTLLFSITKCRVLTGKLLPTELKGNNFPISSTHSVN